MKDFHIEHLTLFVRKITSHNSTGKVSSFSKLAWNFPWNRTSPLTDQTSIIVVAELECEELRLFSKLTWNLLWYCYSRTGKYRARTIFSVNQTTRGVIKVIHKVGKDRQFNLP